MKPISVLYIIVYAVSLALAGPPAPIVDGNLDAAWHDPAVAASFVDAGGTEPTKDGFHETISGDSGFDVGACYAYYDAATDTHVFAASLAAPAWTVVCPDEGFPADYQVYRLIVPTTFGTVRCNVEQIVGDIPPTVRITGPPGVTVVEWAGGAGLPGAPPAFEWRISGLRALLEDPRVLSWGVWADSDYGDLCVGGAEELARSPGPLILP